MENETPNVVRVKKSNTWAIPMAIIIAGALIAGAVYFSQKKTPEVLAQKQQATKQVRPIDKNDHILGNPTAPISIIEYSDLQCPYCQEFQQTMKQVMATYGKDGKVSWVYRHFWAERKNPQTGEIFHPFGGKTAEASECVAELGGNDKFWAFANEIFSDPETQQAKLQKLSEIAVGVGIEKTAFDKCLASGKYKTKIQDSFNEGVSFGVTGTPNTFIISKDTIIPVPGASGIAEMKQIIDSLLNK